MADGDTASVASGDDVPEGNFWDIDSYKVVTRRITRGAKLCDELVKAWQERAIIEKAYAQNLSKWAERWEEKIDKVKEYGTLRDAWGGMINEARLLANVHINVKEKLENELQNDVETWKKAHYQKSFVHFKSHKRASTAFKKAQLPWAKRKEKITKERNAMLKHMEAVQQAKQRIQSGTGETDKNQSVIQKSELEIRKLQEKLKERVGEMLRYKNVYRQEMTVEFDRCQEEERERINFFSQILQSFCTKTDITQGVQSAREATLNRVRGINAQVDLDHFSRDHGVGMPMIVPTITGMFVAENNVPPSEAVSPSLIAPPPVAPLTFVPPAYVPPAAEPAAAATPTAVTATGEAAPCVRLQPGVRLRAMYDYTGQKADELTFDFDDQFVTVLQTPDVESCWIKVRADLTGVIGLVPGNYVEVEEQSTT